MTGSSLLTHVVSVLAIGLTGVGVRAQTPQALLEHYKCSRCHTEREPRTGPAFVDVAAKYRGDPRALATLTAVVKQGAHGTGPWHMPPHPEVSEKDARTIVKYVLSLRHKTHGKVPTLSTTATTQRICKLEPYASARQPGCRRPQCVSLKGGLS